MLNGVVCGERKSSMCTVRRIRGSSVPLARVALIAAMAFTSIFLGCASGPKSSGNASNDTAMEMLPIDNLVRGVDISSVIAEENSGVVYRDADGNPQDIFKTLADSGVNCIRVRVWNNPYNDKGKGFGGGNNDVPTAVEIAKRAAAVGLPLLVDFHYSDFWADPAKQKAPREWASMSVDDKAQALGGFTEDSLHQIQDTGAVISMVQVGNETTTGMCGVSNSNGWQDVAKLMNAGSAAVRRAAPQALVVLHFTNPEKKGHYEWIASNLDQNNVDYDVFASSWYPLWHGTRENLRSVLENVADKYGKKVMIAEFAHPYTYKEGDGHDNTFNSNTPKGSDKWAVSVEGQKQFVTDTLQMVASLGDKAVGAFWWEAAWIPVPKNDKGERRPVWEQYGSGWASSYSGVYDSDAGKWYGGSAVDNQALFDFDGKALPSLEAFEPQ